MWGLFVLLSSFYFFLWPQRMLAIQSVLRAYSWCCCALAAVLLLMAVPTHAQVIKRSPPPAKTANRVSPSVNLVWTSEQESLVRDWMEKRQWREALDYMLASESRYAGQVAYDYQLGVVAIKLEDWSLALQALERVVLIQPDHGGAWLDLAIVHEKLEDYATSWSILEHIQQQLTPPSDLLAQIQFAKRQLKERALARTPWRYEWSIFGGRVANVNAGLSQLNVLLTPAGFNPIPVMIDPSQKARADNALVTRFELYYQPEFLVSADRFLACRLGLGSRNHAQFRDYDVQDVQGSCVYDSGFAEGGRWRWQAGPSLGHVQRGYAPVGQLYSVQAGLYRPWGALQTGMRVELDQRSYQAKGYYSSLTPWFGPWLSYQAGRSQGMLGYRWGHDQASGDRPGGVTIKQELYGHWTYRWSHEYAGFAHMLYGRYADQTMYSPVLANQASRWVNRWVARIGVDWRQPEWFNKDLFVSAYYEFSQDQSNIMTNQIQDRQIFMGLRYQFR